MRLVPIRSWRANSLRTKPRSAIARSTRSRVAALTTAGRLSTLETVPSDTPAAAATSLTEGERQPDVAIAHLLVVTARTGSP